MPDDARENRDHPYVAHYEWSAVPGAEDPERLTPEQQAANDQHAIDKEAVEGRRGLRLVLAVPIILCGVIALPALVLLVFVLIISAFDRSLVSSVVASWGLAGVLALLVLIEVTCVWEGKLLLRNDLVARRWAIVLMLTLASAVSVTVALAPWEGTSTEAWLGLAAAWYALLVAAAQLVRARRLAPAAGRLEQYSP
jgi:hypothetical protein